VTTTSARPRVSLDTQPNSEGWKSWVVTSPSGSRYLFDKLPEAHDYAANLALVHAMFWNPKLGDRVHIIGNRYTEQAGWIGVDFTDHSGTVVALEPEHENPVEVELDHLGYSVMFHPSELEVLS
jgi:hypothetical protein